MSKLNEKKARARYLWPRIWMKFAGQPYLGRLAMRIASIAVPPYKGRIFLSDMSHHGFIEYDVIMHHSDLRMGNHCFIGSRVVIFERKAGGFIQLEDRVQINSGSYLETGLGGKIIIRKNASIHPGCHLYAYLSAIEIGSGVMLAPGCAIYSYDHGLSPKAPIRKQPPTTKGGVVIGDEAWLGYGTIVLNGVNIGKGAAIGAGSVVVRDIPENAIAVGNPARVVGMR